MSSLEAICRFRVEQSISYDIDIPIETRLQWLRIISKEYLKQRNSDNSNEIRDWDFVMKLDGTGNNHADNTSPAALSSRTYPVQYQIPPVIIDSLPSDEVKVKRRELFAIGGLLYEVISGGKMMSGTDGADHIQSCLAKGEFPEDVWDLPRAASILACWCPGFAEDILAAHRRNSMSSMSRSVSLMPALGAWFSFLPRLATVINYITEHPILFGLQVTGGIVSLTSLIALPVLGAVGFGVAGPVAGSAAAAWQSSIGLVEAGSFFAWCQSAAMGGAAVGGIMASGVTGAGLAVVAALTGGLDRIKTSRSGMKEAFLFAWNREMQRAESVSAQH